MRQNPHVRICAPWGARVSNDPGLPDVRQAWRAAPCLAHVNRKANADRGSDVRGQVPWRP